MSIASAIVAPIHVKRLVVAIEKVAELTPEERYAYYMLGHLFNELMFIQKLLHYSIPKHDDGRLLRRLPEYGQLFFTSRLAAGKLWEAKVALERPALSIAIRDSFTPLMPSRDDRLRTWRRRANKSEWLKKLRNSHSFHYPSLEQWAGLLQPDADWEDDHIYMAKESGNVYYAASDAMANHWMFQQLNQQDPRAAVDPMICELISLLGEFNGAVEDTLGAFISERLLGNTPQPESNVGTVDTVLFEHVSIPFWTNMPPRRAAP